MVQMTSIYETKASATVKFKLNKIEKYASLTTQ